MNNSFTDKIREQVHARNQLQTHLAKVRFIPRHYVTCHLCIGIRVFVIKELLFANTELITLPLLESAETDFCIRCLSTESE